MTAEHVVRRIETMICNLVAGTASRAAGEIDIDAPLAHLGLSSQEFVVLAGELEEALGCELSPTLAWEHPTIRRLAEFLAAQTAGREAT